MAGALHGIKVIDFGQYMAGPMGAMLLGDQGADVVRVDPPGGPRWNTPANATWNRGKRSIVLDLKKDADRETAKKLIAGADVVIENFRPGVMDRLGLGATAMTAANQRLIYCSLPGFGADDPRAQVRAWEGVLGAATGAYKPNPELDRTRPVYTVIPYASAYGAFLCAVSVAMALNERTRSGLGQRVEIPLYDGTFIAMGSRGMKVHNHPEVPPPFNWSRPALCKDGRWVTYVANNMRHPSFLKETGADEWIKAGLSPQELTKRFAELFAARTSQEWEAFCARVGTECVTCHTSAEWLEHPQAAATKIIDTFDDPELGRFKGPGINVRLHDTPGSVRSPRPKLDAHREEILKELAAGRMPVSAAGAEPALRSVLQGVKVLDLCIILAGPACGRTLAEFGADVIKIDDPRRNPLRFHHDINRGKRTILLDLKSDEGRKVMWKLIDQADVILQNYRKDAADRLGIGYEAVKARRPGIVYASLNTFGQDGPFAGRPGHEQLGQSITGMQMRFGVDKPVVGPFPANDFGTGLMGCYSVALALLEQKRTGRGQMVDTALAYTATLLQSAIMLGYPGKEWNEPRGQQALGSGALHRAYQAADGWLFLGAREADLKACAELADLAGKSASALEQALEERMKTRTVAAWVEALTRSGIGAHAVELDLEKLMENPLVVKRGLSITREHEVVGPVTTNGTAVRLSRTPVSPGAPARKPGADAASVLAEIGMGAELERLVKQRVVVIDGVEAGT
jgi:crotonobetainyl-CoA:carnitine CoA-transferase CaiB-like acyl-CoA transferase